jgi:hypothetical protein
MKNLELGHIMLNSCVALALLAGCGGSQPPIGAPGAMPQTFALAAHADRGTSWMLPEAASQDLLYVSSHNYVSIYTYPGGQLVGKLRGFYLASGQCVDSSNNVYITDYGMNRVFEYAHGNSKRLRTILTPGANSCSIDATTGNLAVSSLGNGALYVFKNAKGKPTKYKNSQFVYYYGCGYDANGNLFVDGMTRLGTGNFIFAELPKGGSQLEVVRLNQYIGWPSAIQWDGKHIAVVDQNVPAIYQFSVRGRRGTKVGTTSLGSNAWDTLQFWIQGQTVITSTDCYPPRGCGHTKLGSALMFFNFPAGGNATKIITKGMVGGPGGDSVSLASK